MPFDLSPDQEFLRETTAKFLASAASPDRLRGLRDDPVGYDETYWAAGADRGWTSLLVSEEHGGGTVSGQGIVDITLIAHEFGRYAAPGPLMGSNVVASALSAEREGTHLKVLAELLTGSSTAAWCFAEPQPAGRLSVELEVERDGDEVVLTGVKRPVESAGKVDHFLVTGRTGGGLTQVLVPRDATGLSVGPLKTVDLTRRFGIVSFDGVRVPLDAVLGEIGGAATQVERQLQLALCILNAESIGAIDTAFAMTLQWAFDRYSFGRPLASYQELKHRFADMKSWLEASHAIGDASSLAVQSGSADASELVSVAKSFIGDYSTELLQDCVQIHGGIGVTFEHDLHLFVRRGTLNRALLGTPADHRQRVAAILIEGEATI